jgi:STE24 endopeptidase
VLQLWMIALLAIVYIHDEAVRHTAETGAAAFSPAIVAWILAPFAVLAIAVHVVCVVAGRQMDRQGSQRAVDGAERMLGISRILAVVMHGAAVFTAGWVEQVRALVGHWIMVAEVVAILPPIFVFVAGWWSFYPIERRMREAMWVRVLEEGHPAYPVPSRWQFVWSNIRHQVLFILVPLVLIGVWRGGWLRLLSRHDEEPLAGFAEWVRASGYSQVIYLMGELGGVAVVLAVAPLIMRLVWDARPLEAGTLRDRLLAVCTRAGVRVRGLLVWRTHGTMINGAAMGLAAPLRYILLTDGLLDQLPERQVESVMGHEVGHAKHHHIPWMLFALLASVAIAGVALFVASVVLAIVVGTMLPQRLQPVLAGGIEVVGSIAVLGFALLAFGWISRRFEWQADAFAAKIVSREDPANKVVTQESVDSMCGALQSVADLNHMPPERRSFRHGSIATRQKRLQRLVGVRLDRLPIDRTCRWIKGGIVTGVLLAVLAISAPGLARSMFDRPHYDYPDWAQTKESRLEDAP